MNETVRCRNCEVSINARYARHTVEFKRGPFCGSCFPLAEDADTALREWYAARNDAALVREQLVKLAAAYEHARAAPIPEVQRQLAEERATCRSLAERAAVAEERLLAAHRQLDELQVPRDCVPVANSDWSRFGHVELKLAERIRALYEKMQEETDEETVKLQRASSDKHALRIELAHVIDALNELGAPMTQEHTKLSASGRVHALANQNKREKDNAVELREATITRLQGDLRIANKTIEELQVEIAGWESLNQTKEREHEDALTALREERDQARGDAADNRRAADLLAKARDTLAERLERDPWRILGMLEDQIEVWKAALGHGELPNVALEGDSRPFPVAGAPRRKADGELVREGPSWLPWWLAEFISVRRALMMGSEVLDEWIKHGVLGSTAATEIVAHAKKPDTVQAIANGGGFTRAEIFEAFGPTVHRER